jgi:hypothetical protein
MTSVRQKIPNFIGGISQQPDEKIPPGTVKDALNVVPDVKGILGKRPGSKLVGTLSDHTEGVWHHYFRDNNEQYFIRIRRDGQVDVWEALTGIPRTVKYNSNPYNLAEDKYLNNGEPTIDTDAAFPSCSPTEFAAKTADLQEAYFALTNHKNEIERLEVQKNDLFDVETYYKRVGTDLQVGYAVSNYAYEGGTIPTISRGEPVPPEGYVVKKEYVETARIEFPRFGAPSNVTFTSPDYQTVKCYRWRVERLPGTQEELDIDAQIAALNAQTDDLLDDYTVALSFYEQEAAKCGIFENPYSRATKTTEEVAAPEYFKHENDSDLHFLTVNDYTFVTNRTKIVNMVDGDASDELLEGEAFIELKQLEYNKPYVIRIYGEEPVTNEYTTATKLEVDRKSFTNSDASCSLSGFSEGTVNGIQYRLTVTGYPVLEAEPDNKDAYDCQYRVEVDLISAEPNTGLSTPPFNVTVSGKTYTISVVKESKSATTAESVISVPALTTDEKLDAAALLTELATRIDDGTTGIEARVIGNGVYVYSQIKKFTVDTPDTLLFECINKEVNNVGLLPTQCKDGFVVKVKNSFIEEDDYYVKFASTIPGTDGAGAWEETYKPGIQLGFDYYNMPHQIRRLSDGTFEVSPIHYADREVGDDLTNSKPSFIGSTINKMLFFRDRFCLLSDENIIMSRPNEYFNYWANTAMTVSDADPIDLRCSSTTPAILYDGIEAAPGLVLFAANQQFLVVTDNTDVFSPRTANVKSIGTYKYNTKVKPIQMGQTIGFLNDAGYRSRFFELIPSRDYDYEAVETSKPVDQLIPQGLDLLGSSRDNSMAAFAVKGEDDVYVYRFFNEGEKRVQSAWVKWQLSSNILYHCIMKDKYFAVLNVETGSPTTPNIVNLQQFDLKLDKNSFLVTIEGDDMLNYDYQVHMDNYFMVTSAETFQGWDPVDKTTTFRLPIGFHGPRPIAVYELENENGGYVPSGRYANPISTTGVPNGVLVTMQGDWRDKHLMCGYDFDMEVLLPKFYVTKAQDNQFTADTTGSLVVHRVTLSHEATGYHTVEVHRKGREPYNVSYESTHQDAYEADTPAIEPDVYTTIPLYDKNTNIDIRIKSTHPTPTNIISATWEGDYNPRYYRNV